MSTSRRLRSMSMRIRLDVFAPLWVAYALLVARFAFVTDDAFITFRYARNLIDGHGLRFNPGDPVPVEGYSNFLWVLLSAVVEALGLAPSFWIPLVSFLCGSVLLFLVFDELQRRRGVPAPLAGLASATLALSPAFALWSTSGLETVPFALLLYLTADRLIFRSSRPDGEGIDVRTTAVLALAVSLIRVEGILWVGVLIGVAALSARVSGRARDRTPLVRIAAIVAAGYAVYFAFRTVYFQDWLPNTVHAKSGLPVALLLRGFDYVAVHFLTAVTPFLLFVATPFALARERRSLGLPVALLAWAFPVYAVATTGDFMAMGRFLVPGLPYAAILVGLWLQATPRRGSRLLVPAAAVVAVAVGAGLLPSVGVYAVPESVRARFHFRLSADRFRGEFAQWQYQRDNAAAWACKGRALRRYAAARLGPGTDPSVVQVAVGAVGYYSDLFVYDGAGLVSPAVARRALPPPSQQPPRSPGHDRVVGPRFFLPAEPTLLRADVVEDGAPAARVAAVEESAKALRGAWPELEPAQRYVQDFARIASPGGDCGPVTLATWRRIAPGEDWRREWADFDARLRRFRESGEIVTISAEAGASLPASEGGRPDVLLVLVDTLRFDRVGAYGADRPTTPNLDALAKSGVRFERAYSPAPWTKPAAASILTGLYPSSHGATAVASRLSEEVTTLAEVLEAEGYATYGVVSGSFLGSHHGFGQGFDHYDESQIRGSTASTTREVTERALAFARDAAGHADPFFLFVHYFDPHYIYRHRPGVGFSPERAGRLDGTEGIHELRRLGADASAEEIEFLRARYDEEIRFTDAGLGALIRGLRELGAHRELIWVITADHGEEILERGWLGHTRTLYEELLRVPLLVGAPGRVRPGLVVAQPVSTVAVTPTILDWLGLDAPGGPLQAPSFAALAEGADGDPSAQVLGEVDFQPVKPANTLKTAFKKALIGARYKLIRDDPTGRYELYDLRSDPLEQRDLAAEEPERVAALASILEERLARVRGTGPGLPADGVELSEEQLETLRSLGYVGD